MTRVGTNRRLANMCYSRVASVNDFREATLRAQPRNVAAWHEPPSLAREASEGIRIRVKERIQGGHGAPSVVIDVDIQRLQPKLTPDIVHPCQKLLELVAVKPQTSDARCRRGKAASGIAGRGFPRARTLQTRERCNEGEYVPHHITERIVREFLEAWKVRRWTGGSRDDQQEVENNVNELLSQLLSGRHECEGGGSERYITERVESLTHLVTLTSTIKHAQVLGRVEEVPSKVSSSPGSPARVVQAFTKPWPILSITFQHPAVTSKTRAHARPPNIFLLTTTTIRLLTADLVALSKAKQG
ncbi:hypothetical protein C8R44DRAFT_728458 [Mycena epipterygia]|nr:hypothetical protein C8R44DRAFT_728458 [Mycena epipterygia]